MSNECINTIIITGPEAPLTTLKNIAIRHDVNNYCGSPDPYIFDLKRLHPNPYKNTSADSTADLNVPGELGQRTNWYHENWGTTKPCIFKEIENSDEKYIVKFFTNYSPPLKAFIKISQDFPELTFEIDFWGVGSGFCGTYAYRDGQCVFGEFFEHDEYDALFPEQPRGEAPHNLNDGDDEIESDGDVQDLFAEEAALLQQ